MEKVAYAQAASQGAPQAMQVGERFPIVPNLTEATQLLLARCQAEIVAASKADESERYDQPKQIILIEEWRPPEPAHVEKVRLTRRAGRYARYQQVVQLREQGMAAKEIARRLDLSQRTVQRWLTAGTFPEAKKRRKRQSSFDAFARLSPEALGRGRANWHDALARNQGPGLHWDTAKCVSVPGNASLRQK